MSMNDHDPTEQFRRAQQATINAEATNRAALAERYGPVYDTDELQEAFAVTGFAAPYVVVRRRSDGVKGTLTFQHSPRYYFDFTPV